jgi:hypothetical protein
VSTQVALMPSHGVSGRRDVRAGTISDTALRILNSNAYHHRKWRNMTTNTPTSIRAVDESAVLNLIHGVGAIATESESAISACRAGSSRSSVRMLGQPLAHIPLAASAYRAQFVDGQARGDGCHERSR